MTKINKQLQALLRVSEERSKVHAWEANFQARMRRERKYESAKVTLALACAMWHARDEGATIADIGEYYGTKDRATVMRKIAEYQTIVDETNASRADANPDPQTA